MLNLNHLGAEESTGKGCERRRVAGGNEAMLRCGIGWVSLKPMRHQGAIHILGGFIRTRHERDVIANHVRDHTGQQWVVSAPKNHGVNTLAGEWIEILVGNLLKLIEARGRVVLVGTLAGGRTDLPILAVMSKRLTLHGTVLRPRSREEKAAATAAFAAEVVPLLADGRVAPVVERIVPLDEAEAAYALLASDATFGKVILDCA